LNIALVTPRYSNNKEVWKVIPGSEEMYAVSSLGRIVQLEDSKFIKAGTIRKLTLNNGYLECTLLIDGERKAFRVHSLVASAFLGKRPKKFDVNHKDGVKTHNNPRNLEYVSRSRNCKHAYDKGLKEPNRGGGDKRIGLDRPQCMFTVTDIKRIRRLYAKGKSITNLSDLYRVDWSVVKRIVTNQTYKEVA
jgi:hypothetical protein